MTKPPGFSYLRWAQVLREIAFTDEYDSYGATCHLGSPANGLPFAVRAYDTDELIEMNSDL